MIILDANAILRYILRDIPEQAERVAETIINNKVLILPEVVAEIVYVLKGHYGVARENISDVILDVLDDTECDSLVLREGLYAYRRTNMDIVDCFLFAYSTTHKIFTFDKRLDNLIAKGLAE